MPARLIDGRAIAERVKRTIAKDVAIMSTKPCLAVLMIGDNPSSRIYVSRKEAACEGVGIEMRNVTLPASAKESEVLEQVAVLNHDSGVHGILAQLPIPSQISEQHVLESIDPRKDVDGLNPVNVGRLHSGGQPMFIPATPKAIMHVLKEERVVLAGKNAVVVGRSNLVGRPVAALLLDARATVTQCHSRTPRLADVTKRADVLIVAAGKPRLITSDFVNKGAVVIDVGINRLVDGRIVGDVDEEVRNVASVLTPVPGGVGPITIAMLLENMVKACRELT